MHAKAATAVSGPPAAPPLTALVVDTVEQLEAHVSAWEALAAAALEPNIFFEPWLLLPALKAYGRGSRLRFLLLFAPDPSRLRQRLLCGFFPLERRAHCHGLPCPCLRMWRHPHCYLATPLLRTGYARDCLTAFFAWLATDRHSAPLLSLDLIPAEGPWHRLLSDYLHEQAPLVFVADSWTRAFFEPGASGEAYLRASLSGTHRRALQRRRKRLAEQGRLECRTLANGEDAEPWIAEFLRLEAGGWKGRQGTALASAAADRDFFTAVAGEAHRRGRLMLVALTLDGRPIACRCSFRAGDGSLAFKTAFDEAFTSFSPGALLEVEHIHHLHAVPGLRWMDSCTSPDNTLFNRLWKDRRAFQSLVIATGKRPGTLVVSLLPLLRCLKRALPWPRIKRARQCPKR
jgi:hypothetical protein